MVKSTITVTGTVKLSNSITLVKIRASKEFECIVTETHRGPKFYYLNASAPRDRQLFENYYIDSTK